MSKETIYICCASDKKFVMPLTVTLVSLSVNLDQSRKAVVYVLDGGIRKSDRDKLLKSIKAKNIELKFIKIEDHDIFKDMVVTRCFPRAAYYRLLIPSLVSEDIKKIIYLDSDLVVNADIGRLWDIDVGGNYVLAAQEQGKDFLYVSSQGGLLNYKELGIDPTCKYFNSGVLVINLDKWREQKISQKVIDHIRENVKYIRWPDQDGLNAVLVDKWGELDLRWNLSGQIFNNSRWDEGPVKDKKRYSELIAHPYIIHFCTSSKPWHYENTHPFKGLFFKYLSLTRWRLPLIVRMLSWCTRKRRAILSNALPRPIKKFVKNFSRKHN